MIVYTILFQILCHLAADKKETVVKLYYLIYNCSPFNLEMYCVY